MTILGRININRSQVFREVVQTHTLLDCTFAGRASKPGLEVGKRRHS